MDQRAYGGVGMEIQITKRQRAFIEAGAFEGLFGGAAGGGKSHGQIVDAFIYALRDPHSRQLLLRRTYPELEKSLVRTALALYPADLYSYAASRRLGSFVKVKINECMDADLAGELVE